MKILFAIVLFTIVFAHDAKARWAELYFSPDLTNQYGFTIQVVSTDVTNGIQFSVRISSSFTNEVPKHPEQVHVQKLSSGELSSAAISVTNGDNWACFVFVIPSTELDKAEFMWSRCYEGSYEKLGGSFRRVNLKKYGSF